jgi:CRISPR system Cascade subunit CasB
MIGERNAAVAWWRALQPDPEHDHGGDSATLARLRRCASIAELMLEPATIALFRRCKANDPRDLPAIALTAGVLAHVRAHDPALPVARRVGPEVPEKPETALLKPLRFRALMEARTEDERLTAFRRLVGLADRTLNVADLADALLRWNDECRRRWVFAYWNADPRPSAGAATSVTAPAKDTAA